MARSVTLFTVVASASGASLQGGGLHGDISPPTMRLRVHPLLADLGPPRLVAQLPRVQYPCDDGGVGCIPPGEGQ